MFRHGKITAEDADKIIQFYQVVTLLLLYHVLFEEFNLCVVPIGVLGVVSAVGVDDEVFGRLDKVVSRKVGVRRAYRILQSHSHKYRAFNVASMVFDVEVGERSVKGGVVKPKFLLLAKYWVGRPVYNLEVVGVVAEEWNPRSCSTNSLVERACCHGECATLATAFGEGVA